MTISTGALIGSSLIASGTALANKLIEKRRYERQFSDQHKLWQENNAYNSPQAQMARLKVAGLNPNLVYQNGGAVSPSDQLTPPDWQNSPISEFNNLGEMAIQGASVDADIANKQALNEQIKADTAAQLVRNKYLSTKEKMSIAQTQASIFESGQRSSLLGAQFGLTQQQITNSQLEYHEIGARIDKLKSEKFLNDKQSQVFDHEIDRIDSITDLTKKQVAKTIVETFTQKMLNGLYGKQQQQIDVAIKKMQQEIDELMWFNSDDVRNINLQYDWKNPFQLYYQLKNFSSHKQNSSNPYNK